MSETHPVINFIYFSLFISAGWIGGKYTPLDTPLFFIYCIALGTAFSIIAIYYLEG